MVGRELGLLLAANQDRIVAVRQYFRSFAAGRNRQHFRRASYRLSRDSEKSLRRCRARVLTAVKWTSNG